MYTVTISEEVDGNGVVLRSYKNGLPAGVGLVFATVEGAMASEPTLAWEEVTDQMREEEEIDGDVLYVATFR